MKSRIPNIGILRIVPASKALIMDTAAILSDLEIKHYCIEWKKTNGDQNAHLVEVVRPHVSEFMRIIGSHNSKHITKFQIWQRFGFYPPRTIPVQREAILKGLLNPHFLIAGVG